MSERVAGAEREQLRGEIYSAVYEAIARGKRGSVVPAANEATDRIMERFREALSGEAASLPAPDVALGETRVCVGCTRTMRAGECAVGLPGRTVYYGTTCGCADRYEVRAVVARKAAAGDLQAPLPLTDEPQSDEPREQPDGWVIWFRHHSEADGFGKRIFATRTEAQEACGDCEAPRPVYIDRPVSPAQTFDAPRGWDCEICATPVNPDEDRFMVDGDKLVAHTTCLEYATVGKTPEETLACIRDWFNAEPSGVSPAKEVALSGAQEEIREFEERLRRRGAVREAALTSLLERVREFLRKHNSGGKAGREDYGTLVRLSDLEPLRIAMVEYARHDSTDNAAAVPVAEPALSVGKLREALRRIANHTSDPGLGYEANGYNRVREIARAALSGSAAKPVEGP